MDIKTDMISSTTNQGFSQLKRGKPTFKEYISPMELRATFNLSTETYKLMLSDGLPQYCLCGVVRHNIFDAQDWIDKNIDIYKPIENCYTANELKTMFKIDPKTFEILEMNGMPKRVGFDKKGKKKIYYNLDDVQEWYINYKRMD